MIPYGKQSIDDTDIQSVLEVLKSDFLTQGPTVPAFERSVANYCGSNYAVATNSATSALHLSCLALDIGKEDIVWTSPITFVASANCALYCGAKIDFIDIDKYSYNLSVDSLEKKLEEAKAVNQLPKAIIPVHLCGQSCDMVAINALKKRYDFKIIEDASHAIGGKYKDFAIGSCQFSDITIFSFHPVKIITTAEGGMAVTNDEHLAKRMMLLRSHGITRDTNEMTHTPDGPWYYQQIDLGYNYRMTDLQAGLGLSQIKRIDSFVAQRQNIAKMYDEILSDLPVITPKQSIDNYSARHLYVIRLDLEKISSTHREVFEFMRTEGVGVNLHYIPVYLQPYYKKLGFKPGYCPEAERYYAEAISLPIYPQLNETQINFVADVLRRAINK